MIPATRWLRTHSLRIVGACLLLVVAWRAGNFLVHARYFSTVPMFWLSVGLNVLFWTLWGIAGGLCLWGGHSRRAALWLVAGCVLGSLTLWWMNSPGPAGSRAVDVTLYAFLLIGFLWQGKPLGLPAWYRPVALAVLLFLAFLAWNLAWTSLYKTEESPAVVAALERGNEAAEAGRLDEAVDEWAWVIGHAASPSSWGVATYNTGVIRMQQGRYDEAADHFRALLHSPVDDLDPSPNLMEAYRNYRYYACLQLSTCAEQQGDWPAALRWAERARDDHPYQSWCGTCSWEAAMALRERIERLSREVEERP